MTRKDFVLIAQSLNRIEDKDARFLASTEIARALSNQYPRFNLAKFLLAVNA